MSHHDEVNIAFSGGLESTYLAQLMVERGYKVKLWFFPVSGVSPSPAEASLIYNVYKKLNKLYPNHISMYYTPKRYFGTYQQGIQVLYINQTFRIACMLADIQTESPETMVMTGWIKEDTFEHSISPGDYSVKDYDDLKLLPVTLNHLSRLTVKPHSILTPLWDMTKHEIYEKINKELFEVIVLNMTPHGHIIEGKLEEYKKAGIPLPGYVADNKVTKAGLDDHINDFGRFFYGQSDWRAMLAKDGLEIKGHISKYLSVEPQLPDCRHIGGDGVAYYANNYYSFLKSIATPIKPKDNPMQNIKANLLKACDVKPITIVDTQYHNLQVLVGVVAKELFKNGGRELESRITHSDFYNKERSDVDLNTFKVAEFCIEQQVDYQEVTRWIGYQRVMTKVSVGVFYNNDSKDFTVTATAKFERLKEDRFYNPEVLGVEFTANQVDKLFPILNSTDMKAFVAATDAYILKDYPLVMKADDARMYDSGVTRTLSFVITEPEPEKTDT